ncbi:hypothetical protein AR445_25735 [Klebsiella quasipneumoniae]|nr:hypothetical protein AR445_25735 [Klebsiella quasipneumoniae]
MFYLFPAYVIWFFWHMYGDKPCYFIGILALPRGALKQNIMYPLQWGFSHMLILHLSPGRAIIISSA